MGRKSDRKGRIDLGGPTGGLSSNPFASLARSKPQSPEPEVAPEGLATGGTVARGTVEVRFERKGRGGKEVTVARWLSTPPDEEALERLARRRRIHGPEAITQSVHLRDDRVVGRHVVLVETLEGTVEHN